LIDEGAKSDQWIWYNLGEECAVGWNDRKEGIPTGNL
jgi:hypothetical protein